MKILWWNIQRTDEVNRFKNLWELEKTAHGCDLE